MKIVIEQKDSSTTVTIENGNGTNGSNEENAQEKAIERASSRMRYADRNAPPKPFASKENEERFISIFEDAVNKIKKAMLAATPQQ